MRSTRPGLRRLGRGGEGYRRLADGELDHSDEVRKEGTGSGGGMARAGGDRGTAFLFDVDEEKPSPAG